MTLASTLGICALLLSPPVGMAATRYVQAAQTVTSSTQSQADSTQTNPPQPAQATQPQEKPATETPAKPGESAQAPAQEKPKPTTSTSPKKRKHRRTQKPAAQTNTTPPKVVVRNGGTGDPTPQLAPGLTKQQAASKRQNTGQLLATTDANLKKLAARQLAASQQDAVKQVEQYAEQAKAALKTGDVERAHNLATKAQLLSDDLVKH